MGVTWNISSWRLWSDHFPFFLWVMAVGSSRSSSRVYPVILNTQHWKGWIFCGGEYLTNDPTPRKLTQSTLWFWGFWGSEQPAPHLGSENTWKSLATICSLPQYHRVVTASEFTPENSNGWSKNHIWYHMILNRSDVCNDFIYIYNAEYIYIYICTYLLISI